MPVGEKVLRNTPIQNRARQFHTKLSAKPPCSRHRRPRTKISMKRTAVPHAHCSTDTAGVPPRTPRQLSLVRGITAGNTEHHANHAKTVPHREGPVLGFLVRRGAGASLRRRRRRAQNARAEVLHPASSWIKVGVVRRWRPPSLHGPHIFRVRCKVFRKRNRRIDVERGRGWRMGTSEGGG